MRSVQLAVSKYQLPRPFMDRSKASQPCREVLEESCCVSEQDSVEPRTQMTYLIHLGSHGRQDGTDLLQDRDGRDGHGKRSFPQDTKEGLPVTVDECRVCLFEKIGVVRSDASLE